MGRPRRGDRNRRLRTVHQRDLPHLQQSIHDAATPSSVWVERLLPDVAVIAFGAGGEVRTARTPSTGSYSGSDLRTYFPGHNGLES